MKFTQKPHLESQKPILNFVGVFEQQICQFRQPGVEIKALMNL